jgi:hypothetical protein
LCAINALSQVQKILLSLDVVAGIARLEGYLQTAAGFQEHAKVLDGASDLFHEILGERGAHTRAVIGVGSLPLDAPIEIVVTARIKRFDEEVKIMTALTLKAKEEITGIVRGNVLVSNDTGYDEARQIWNAMIDRRPSLIAQCVQADDVPPIIQFARENRLELAIRGAGHNIAGNSICDNGVVIDFSKMKSVRVDAGKRRAYVEPGATLADFDEAVQAHGLATPVGIIPRRALRA